MSKKEIAKQVSKAIASEVPGFSFEHNTLSYEIQEWMTVGHIMSIDKRIKEIYAKYGLNVDTYNHSFHNLVFDVVELYMDDDE